MLNQTFGRWYVLAEYPTRGKENRLRYYAVCTCGTFKVVTGRDIARKKGGAMSCGCLKREVLTAPRLEQPHSEAYNRTYKIWTGMKTRCLNKANAAYKYYGARGITVHESWMDFKGFLADMGEAPEGLTLERLDNDKGYSPDNCTWVTREAQVDNRSCTKMCNFNGESRPLGQWCRILNLPYDAVLSRINRSGWTVEKSLTTPIRTKRKKQ